ncbi:serine acetyltransferase [Planococcus sp. N064]|uniref:Serine acetyltransferase n=1 Tax=Planococcus liqunii TaxID=3058394 RepID=A0ABT8MNF6_9BACL|nr:serine acetyltransferase [Planococcus sp. N064]MDN7226431.1 serine acetyltransferase [Planococcus sp. N064]
MRKAEILINKSISTYQKGIPLLPKLYTLALRTIFACDVMYTTKIHPSVEFIHNGLGCVVHPKAEISAGCKIYQNVTLGGNGKIVDGKKVNQGGPVLCENVTVFSGACILGPVRIGANSIIGANAVVLKDVPPNSIAVGVPAIIKAKNSEYNFMN